MVPLIFVNSKILKDTIDSYHFFLNNKEDYDKNHDVYRKNLFDFVNDLLGRTVSPLGFDYKEVVKDLNEIYVKKIQDEQQQQKNASPQQTIPLNINELVEYLEQRENDKKLVERIKADQKRWVEAQQKGQKVYAKPIKEFKAVTIDPELAERIDKMAREAGTNPDQAVSAILANIKNTDVIEKLSGAYSPEIIDAVAPSVALDITQNLALLHKKIENESDPAKRKILLGEINPGANRDALVFYMAGLAGTKEAGEFAQAWALKYKFTRDIALAVYGEDFADLFFPTGFQEFRLAQEGDVELHPEIFNQAVVGLGVIRETTLKMNDAEVLASISSEFQGFSTSVYGRKIETDSKVEEGVATTFAGIGITGNTARLFGLPDLTYVRALRLLNKDMEILIGTKGVGIATQIAGLGSLEVSLFPGLAVGITPAVTGAATEAGVGAIVGEAGVVVAAGAATGEVATATGLAAVLGSVVPIVGTAIGAVVGFVFGKIISTVSTGIKKNSGQLLAGGMFILGFLVAGPLGALFAGGVTAFLAGIDWKKWLKRAGWLIGIILAGYYGLFMTAFITMVSLLVGGTIIISLILFIINAGAYVVPGGVGVPQASPGTIVSCFVFGEGWSVADQNLETQAIQEVASFTSYNNKLCAGGQITLVYGGTSNQGYGGCTGCAGANTITIYAQGLVGLPDAKYTLAHESGHIFASRYGSIYQQYYDTVTPLLPCTYRYPTGNPGGEGFAESIALFVMGTVSNPCMGGQSFQDKYPNNYQFMSSNVFN